MTADPFSLDGAVVVVTGAFGQLGAQYTASLLHAGAAVVAVDVAATERGLPAVLESHATRDRLLVASGDVTDRDSLEDVLGRVEQTFGPPTGLVNNAGLDAPPDAPAEENGPFETYPQSSWDDVLRVNVTGVFLCCQVFGGAMARNRAGSVVNIASVYGMVSPDQRVYSFRNDDGEPPFFKPVAYSVSKSALYNLTRYLAVYWADAGVRVNTLTLGGVRRDQDDRFVANYCARVPLGRMAEEDDYNGAVQFLLSDASRYMTGANLVVDGGFTAW